MAADIQHSDALTLVLYLEPQLLKDSKFSMTFSDASDVLGRNPATHSRHIGQVVSRVDAACFYAKAPFLGLHCFRHTDSGLINPESFKDELWGPHRPALIARAERHNWTIDDFKRIKSALHSMGLDSAILLWERIDQFGERGVRQALGMPTK